MKKIYFHSKLFNMKIAIVLVLLFISFEVTAQKQILLGYTESQLLTHLKKKPNDTVFSERKSKMDTVFRYKYHDYEMTYYFDHGRCYKMVCAVFDNDITLDVKDFIKTIAIDTLGEDKWVAHDYSKIPI